MKPKKPKSIFRYKRLDFKSVDKKSKKLEAATARHARKFLLGRLENLKHIRRHLTSWLLLLILLIGLGVFQIIANHASASVDAPLEDAAYAEGVLGPVRNLNPLFASSDAEHSADRLLFLSLFRYDTEGKLQGDAAIDYKIENSGKQYTVNLKEGLKWHDGKPLTADDVVFTIKTIQNPSVGSTQFTGWQNIGVVANGPHQVVFSLPSSYAPFASAMTFPILPSHILAKVPPENLKETGFNTKPVGSGEFKYIDTQTTDAGRGESAIHLQRYDQYWNGKSNLAKFSIYSYGNAKDMLQGLRQREVNAASGIGVDSPGIKTLNIPINSGYFVLFKTDGAPLNDPTLRKALVQATDRKAIRSQMGSKLSLEGPIINNQTPIASKVQQPAYDSVAANQALETLGWKKGADGVRIKVDQKLELRIVAVDSPTYRKLTKLIAKQWKELGVKPIVQLIDPEQMQQVILKPRAYDVLIYELSMGGDPDAYAFWHSSQATGSGLNFSNYKSPVADDTLLTARGRANMILRDSKYASFAQRWVSELPAMALYRSSLLYSTTEGTQSLEADDHLVDAVDRYYRVNDWSSETVQNYNTP